MSRFLLKTLLFFAIVALVDVLSGFCFHVLRGHAKSGNTRKCEYIAHVATDDIIILGSSRAAHHYNPQVIEDSLGFSCFNCGQEGNGIILAYGWFKMLTNRYIPKLIVYEVTPNYDYGLVEPNTKYLGFLRPYYGEKDIKLIFDDFDDGLSRLKMKSYLYQNTNKVLSYFLDFVHKDSSIKGFNPLKGTLSVNSAEDKKSNSFCVDSLKLSYMEKLIVEAQQLGIPIVFAISPSYGGGEYLDYIQPAEELCMKYNVPLYNYLYHRSFSEFRDYFQDKEHLNIKGANQYTHLFIEEALKPICEEVFK